MRDMAAEDSGGSTAGGMLSGLGRGAGAVVSLAVLAALILWSWQLYTRDVGDIPVIRAELGPMRVAPDTPGGVIAPHQGRAINQVIEGEGAAVLETERALAPAPPQPRPDDRVIAAAEPDPEPTLPQAEPTLEDETAAEGPARAGLAESIASAEEPPEPAAGADNDPTAFAPLAGLAAPPRPEGLRTETVSRPAQPSVSGPLRADDVPVGTPIVQLGAFNTVAIADAQWARYRQANADVLGESPYFIEPVNTSSGLLYRLRVAGYASLAEAQSACAALRARGMDCIPAVKR